MADHFRELIERQIAKARMQGQLSGLDGEGNPLPDRPEEAHVDPAEAAGFRIMAQAGAVPEEIQIKKQIAALRARLAQLSDPAERQTAMAELSQLDLRYNIAREARRKFLR
ncbi:MAG: DUF1992 domain-containing protein [Tateyamaria sp.]